MTSSTRLEYINNSLVIKGKVNLYTTNALLSEFKKLFKNEIHKIDCSYIEEADSSAISFLLACLRQARKRNINLNIINMGEQLLNLASLYGVEQLLDNHLEPDQEM